MYNTFKLMMSTIYLYNFSVLFIFYRFSLICNPQRGKLVFSDDDTIILLMQKCIYVSICIVVLLRYYLMSFIHHQVTSIYTFLRFQHPVHGVADFLLNVTCLDVKVIIIKTK